MSVQFLRENGPVKAGDGVKDLHKLGRVVAESFPSTADGESWKIGIIVACDPMQVQWEDGTHSSESSSGEWYDVSFCHDCGCIVCEDEIEHRYRLTRKTAMLGLPIEDLKEYLAVRWAFAWFFQPGKALETASVHKLEELLDEHTPLDPDYSDFPCTRCSCGEECRSRASCLCEHCVDICVREHQLEGGNTMVDVFSAQCKACTTFYATADDISGPYSFAYDYPARYLDLTEEEFIEWDSSSRNSAEQRLRQQDRVKEEAQWLRRLTADIREWHKWKKANPITPGCSHKQYKKTVHSSFRRWQNDFVGRLYPHWFRVAEPIWHRLSNDEASWERWRRYVRSVWGSIASAKAEKAAAKRGRSCVSAAKPALRQTAPRASVWKLGKRCCSSLCPLSILALRQVQRGCRWAICCCKRVVQPDLCIHTLEEFKA